MQNEMKKKRNSVKLVAILVLSIVMVLCGVMFAFSLNSNSKVIAETKNDDPTPLTFTAVQADSKIKFSWKSAETLEGWTTGVKIRTKTKDAESYGDWSDYTADNTITLANVGDSVQFKGVKVVTSSNYKSFVIQLGKISASGDVTSLTNGNEATPGGPVDLSQAYEDLGDGCYNHMFFDCKLLTTAPNLPSTTLVNNCYQHMFQDCEALTTVPKLPAKELADNCYLGMFEGCSALSSMPDLSHVTTLADDCYCSMFAFCTNLEVNILQTERTEYTPIATISGDKVSCCSNMFQNCSKVNGELKSEDGTTNYIYNGFYLTLTAEQDNSSVSFNYNSCGTGTRPQYRILNADNTVKQAWTNCEEPKSTTPTKVNLNKGEKVQFKGKNVVTDAGTDAKNFQMTGKIAASGDVTSLTNYVGGDASLQHDCYGYMFNGCSSLTTAPNLPAKKMELLCYARMFKGCSSLTTAPALPATQLAYFCYGEMFQGCSSLETAPELPVTQLAVNCYNGMFMDCESLTTAPVLPAQKMENQCYARMFKGCSSLTTAPALPATTLANNCYVNMFEGCSSLTTAPALSATELAEKCYANMFEGCSSLETAPDLSATKLAEECYAGMFKNCTSLTKLPKLEATELADGCYGTEGEEEEGNGMFQGCSQLKITKVEEGEDFFFKTPSDFNEDSHAVKMFDGCIIEGFYYLEQESYYAYSINTKDISVDTTQQSTTFDGNQHDFTVKVTSPEGATITGFTVQYAPTGTTKWSDTAPKNAGEYDVKIHRDATGIYNEYNNTITKGLIITPKEVDITWTEPTDFVYSGQPKTYTATYTDINGTIVTLTVSYGEGITPINAGTYTATAQAPIDTNYKFSSTTETSKTFTINKKNGVKATEDKSKTTVTYDGTNFGTVEYLKTCLTMTGFITGDTPQPTATFTIKNSKGETVQEAKNAGTYTINYTYTYDNYADVTGTFTLTINQATANTPTVSGTYTYTGSEQEVQLTGVESYMTVSGDTKGTNAGEYTITVTLDGNHKWAEGQTGEIKWTINKATLTPKTDPQKHVVNGEGFNIVYDESIPEALRITEGWTIQYYVFDRWTTNVPTTPDTYKVKLTRAEGNNFNAYEKEVNDGLELISAIEGQPTQENDYEVKVVDDPSLTNVTYQWKTETWKDLKDVTDLTVQNGTIEKSTNTIKPILVKIFGSNTYIITFQNLPKNAYVEFVFNGTPDNLIIEDGKINIISKTDNQYVIQFTEGAEYPSISNGTNFSLTNVQIRYRTALDGETNAKLGNTTLDNAKYVCDIFNNGKVIATTEQLTPKKVTFESNGGSAIDPMYQLSGRNIDLPDPQTREGYAFDGWFTDATFKTVATNPFQVDDDVTLYAKWNELKEIKIDQTVQQVEYDGTTKSFNIIITEPTGEVIEDFTIEYWLNGSKVDNPTNAGEYKVVITRPADKTYKAFSAEIEDGLVITPKVVTIDWAGTENLVYDGTLKTISASYTKVDGTTKVDLVVSCDPTEVKNAGTYKATASFKTEDKNYKLPDETSTTFVIVKAELDKPTQGTATFTYDGTEKTFTINDVTDKMTRTGDEKGTEAKIYTAKVALNDKNNYVWKNAESGKETEDLEFTFTINKAELTKPTLQDGKGVFTYDGNKHSIIASDLKDFDSDKCTFACGEQTNAGSYTATVTISNTNYCFKNGETELTEITIAWTINQATAVTPTVSGTYTYTGSAQTVSLTGVESYMTTTDSLTQTNAGKYTINYTLTDTTNYKWDDKAGKVEWTISPKEIVIDWGADQTYTGQAITFTATYKDVTQKVVNLNLDFNGAELVNAGTYKGTASFAQGETNYKLPETKTHDFKILKAQNIITIEGGATESEYNGQKVEVRNATATFGTPTHSVSKVVYSNDEVEIKDAGEYIVTYTVAESDNYLAGSNSYTYTVTQKVVETTIEKTSNGVVVKGADGAVIPAKVYYALHKAEHELEDWQEEVPTTAGEYDLKIVLDDGNTKAKTDYIEKGYTVASSGCNGLSWWAIMLICFGVAGIGAGAYFFIIKRRNHDKEAGDR